MSASVRLLIPQSPEVVFEYFVDLRNEPEYNGQVRDIVKTTPGPVGADTTFEGTHLGFGRVTWRLAEYDAPRHVLIEGAVGRGTYRWVSDLEPTSGGTWFTGRMEWEPPPALRHFRAILALMLWWNARRSFRRMAAALERRARARA